MVLKASNIFKNIMNTEQELRTNQSGIRFLLFEINRVLIYNSTIFYFTEKEANLKMF